MKKTSQPKNITFTLDGNQVEACAGESIWQVAQRSGVKIPHLCYAPQPDYRADGNQINCVLKYFPEDL